MIKIETVSDEVVLRDWFAGQALAGILANHMQYTQPDNVAAEAYRMADAMMEARKK